MTPSGLTAPSIIDRVMTWLGRHELAILIAMPLTIGGVWLFVELAAEVSNASTESFDRSVLLAMRNAHDLSDPIGPRWIEEIGRDLTALGGTAVLAMITLGSILFLLLQKMNRAALLVGVALVSGFALSMLLKHLYSRPRPDLVPHGSIVYTASFPSGHAMMSALTYFTLSALLARVQSRRRVRAFLFAAALLITTAVGVSRVYLGVHWPTDVLAGWTLGATWALLWWVIMRTLQASEAIEPPRAWLTVGRISIQSLRSTDPSRHIRNPKPCHS